MDCALLLSSFIVSIKNMLKTPSVIGHMEVEKLFKDLEDIGTKVGDLVLPDKASFSEPGAEAALVQFLTTWLNKGTYNALRIVSSNKQEGLGLTISLEEFSKSHYGFSALALGTEVMCDGVICTGDAHRALKKRLLQISSSDVTHAASREGISLMCVDEMPEVFLSSFYHASPEAAGSLKSFEEFGDVADELLSYPERIEGVFPVDLKKKEDTGRSLVSRILYELFRNTQDHTRRLWDGSLNASSLRGVFVARHVKSYVEWCQHLGNCGPLSTYVQSVQSTLNRDIAKLERLPHGQIAISEKSLLTILEISITDSGSGLAQHYLHTDLISSSVTPKQEHDAVVECFNKHATSTHNPARGLGLHRVLTCLTGLGGFVRIRTGRLNLYRDLNLRPYEKSQIFLDWDTTGPATFNVHPMATGTAISVLIPVRSYE